MAHLTVMSRFRPLRQLQGLRKLQLHMCNYNRQTWNYFQFLKVISEAWNTPRCLTEIKPKLSLPLEQVKSAVFQPKFLDLTSAQVEKLAKNRLYSTCSDKPPNPPKKPDSCPPIDCTPKAKKQECPPKPPACPPKPPACPPKPDCPSKSKSEYDKCPNTRDTASCSTNKPQCPPKCEQPVKPKTCEPPPNKQVCTKPPAAKPSGCAGGQKPPPCSRSFSSCTKSTFEKSNLSVGHQQRKKLQDFCLKKSGNRKKDNCEKNEEKAESYEEKIKREKEEMTTCLKRKSECSGLSYSRIHCKDSIRDVISKDMRKFFREFDPYTRLLSKKMPRNKSNDNERSQWIELLLIQ